MNDEHPLLAAGLLVLCVWEALALTTGVVPTVSTCVARLPLWKRSAIAGASSAALVDHFVTRRLL